MAASTARRMSRYYEHNRRAALAIQAGFFVSDRDHAVHVSLERKGTGFFPAIK